MDFKHFDSRHYKTHEVKEGYRRWAQHYDAMSTGFIDLDLLGQITSVDWSGREEALDLACGTGRIGAWLLEHGVKAVDGVDITEAMLERARDKKIYRSLRLADMTTTGIEARCYDVITCVLAIGHLARLDPFYEEIARLSCQNTDAVIVGYHPHFLLKGVPTHFDPPDGGEPVAIRNHVHLMSDHIKAAQRAGWRLSDMEERVVDDAWLEVRPGWERYRYQPISFALCFERYCVAT